MNVREENKHKTNSKQRYSYENIPPYEKNLIGKKIQRIQDLEIGLRINTVQCYNTNYCFKRKGFESCLIKIFHSVDIRKILLNCLLFSATQLQKYYELLEKNDVSSHVDIWIIIPQNKENEFVVRRILKKWVSVYPIRGGSLLSKIIWIMTTKMMQQSKLKFWNWIIDRTEEEFEHLLRRCSNCKSLPSVMKS